MTLSQIMLVAVLVQFPLALVVFVISVLILHPEAPFIGDQSALLTVAENADARLSLRNRGLANTPMPGKVRRL